MKLRVKRNSLRVRLTRSGLERLVKNARIEETIYFSPDGQSRLMYVPEQSSDAVDVTPRFTLPEIAIVIPTKDAEGEI